MKRMYFIIISFLCTICIHGCTAVSETKPMLEKAQYYKPLNLIQQEYYNVQTLFDARKYQETVEVGEVFVSKYKRDMLSVAVNYYTAASLQKLGSLDKAGKIYKQIISTNPDDEWGKLATVGLEEIKEARGTL